MAKGNMTIRMEPELKAQAAALFKSLPKIVVNGRRQQIMTERGFYGNRYGSDARIVRRHNGKPQTIDYTATIPVSEKLSAYSVRLDEDVFFLMIFWISAASSYSSCSTKRCIRSSSSSTLKSSSF